MIRSAWRWQWPGHRSPVSRSRLRWSFRLDKRPWHRSVRCIQPVPRHRHQSCTHRHRNLPHTRLRQSRRNSNRWQPGKAWTKLRDEWTSWDHLVWGGRIRGGEECDVTGRPNGSSSSGDTRKGAVESDRPCRAERGFVAVTRGVTDRDSFRKGEFSKPCVRLVRIAIRSGCCGGFPVNWPRDSHPESAETHDAAV